MNIKSLVAASTFVMASTCFAQATSPINLTLTPTVGGALGTSFEQAAHGLFVDTFTFTPASVSGSVAVNLTPGTGPINFYSALLNGDGFSYLPERGNPNFAFQTTVDASQPLELTLLGFAGDTDPLTAMDATYRGTITVNAVSAIPEPSTWALMLAGFAVTASLARRRRASKG